MNDQDARPAWSFTALHEVVHLWLGTTGVSGMNTEAQIERYCNDIAGEALLPTSEINDLAHLRGASVDEAVEAVSEFARRRRISRSMVAYKLLRSGVIDEGTWRDLGGHFRREWHASKKRRQLETSRSEGGPSYYVVKRHRLGPALLGLVRGSLSEGALTHTKAGQILGMKPRNVDPLLYGTPMREGR